MADQCPLATTETQMNDELNDLVFYGEWAKEFGEYGVKRYSALFAANSPIEGLTPTKCFAAWAGEGGKYHFASSPRMALALAMDAARAPKSLR